MTLGAEDRCIDDIESPWAYHGPLAAAVHRLKYGGDAAIAGPLGRLLATSPAIERSSRTGRPWDAVVPVPLHWLRAMWRGYNQAELIARWALRATPDAAPLRTDLVVRRRFTPAQSGLPRARRLAQLRGAFVVDRPRLVDGRRVLVIDDVTTTGATLQATGRALLEAGAAEVGMLALLRTLA